MTVRKTSTALKGETTVGSMGWAVPVHFGGQEPGHMYQLTTLFDPDTSTQATVGGVQWPYPVDDNGNYDNVVPSQQIDFLTKGYAGSLTCKLQEPGAGRDDPPAVGPDGTPLVMTIRTA